MRCAVYCRLSLDRAGDELGVERQREDCLRLVNQRGDQLVGVYIDNDLSATKGGKRPRYAALIAAVQRGEVDRIVVWMNSRLWRNRRERAEGIEILRQHRISLLPVKGPELDMSTAYGRGMAGLIGEFDTMEVEVKGERQEREAQQRADRGEPPGGRRAFGYTATGAKQVREEAAAVKRAYASLLAGATLSGIAADLNAAGLTTTMGGPWRHNAVRAMLANPRYAAIRTHKGVEVGPATWRPIVTEDVYRAAADLLAAPERRTNHRGNALTHLGTHLYVCGRCPDQTVICTYRGSKAAGTQRRVYRCMGCYLTRGADPIDHLVTRVVVERLRRPDLADLLALPIGNTDVGALGTEAKALRLRLNALADNLALDEAVLARRAGKIRERLGEIKRELAEAGKGSAAGSLLGAPDPGQAWLDLADMARRQAVVRDLMTVRLLATGPGRRVFDPTTVDIKWKGQA